MTSKVHFYCSRLNGNKICWPVEVLSTNQQDGWHHVRGLAGRFKGRSFTVVGSEISSYVPKGYKLAPGAKAFLPKISSEYAKAKKLHAQTYKLVVGAYEHSNAIPIAVAEKLLFQTEMLAASLRPKTSSDHAWPSYDESIERAKDHIHDASRARAVGSIHNALEVVEGAASRMPLRGGDPARRVKSSHRVSSVNRRDPFFGKKLGGRAKSRLSEGRSKRKFDSLYQGFKNEGASAPVAYRRAIQMMPGYHSPATQKAWLEDLKEFEKHSRDPIIRKVGNGFMGNGFNIMTRLNDPKYGGQGLPWVTMRWTMVGNTDRTGTITVGTKAEAEKIIRDVRTYGPDWYAAEYKVISSKRGKR